MPGAADRNHARAEGFQLEHDVARGLEHAKTVIVRLRQHHGRKPARDATLECVEIADPMRVRAGLPGGAAALVEFLRSRRERGKSAVRGLDYQRIASCHPSGSEPVD